MNGKQLKSTSSISHDTKKSLSNLHQASTSETRDGGYFPQSTSPAQTQSQSFHESLSLINSAESLDFQYANTQKYSTAILTAAESPHVYVPACLQERLVDQHGNLVVKVFSYSTVKNGMGASLKHQELELGEIGSSTYFEQGFEGSRKEGGDLDGYLVGIGSQFDD